MTATAVVTDPGALGAPGLAPGPSPAPRPLLRLAPRAEAPGRWIDDEDHLPAAPRVQSVLSPVTERLWPVPAPVLPAPEPPLPDPTKLSASLVLAAVEVLAGTRPVTQLVRWVSPQVLEALSEARSRGDRRPAVVDGVASSPTRHAPMRRRPDARPSVGAGPPDAPAARRATGTASSGRPATGPAVPPARATIRRTHLSRVSPTAAEASVVLVDGGRVRAAALRLEVHRGRWRATVLQIG